MSDLLRRLWHEQCGEDDTEYALLIALIALVLVIVLGHVGKAIQQSVDRTPAVIASGVPAAAAGRVRVADLRAAANQETVEAAAAAPPATAPVAVDPAAVAAQGPVQGRSTILRLA